MTLSSKLIKTLVFTGWALSSLSVFSAEPVPVRENKLSIGGGFTFNSAQYRGSESFVDPVPLFDIQLGPIFAYNHHDEPYVGLELFRHKRVMFAIAATQGRTELDLSNIRESQFSPYYLGIEDRDKSIEAGYIFNFYSRVGLLEIMTFRDVSNNHKGIRSFVGWSRPFPETGNWTITPRMFGKYYSEKYNRYYYGVSEEDMDRGIDLAQSQIPGYTPERFEELRPQFESGNAGQFGIDLSVEYRFTNYLKAQGYLGWEQLAGQVTSSTLVADSEVWTANLGLVFTF